MVTIGIDPSINSTGVCVDEDGYLKYYIIPSKMTKKMKAFSHPRIKLCPYEKQGEKTNDYRLKEQQKTNNIFHICQQIGRIMELHSPDKILMEGVSYGSTGSAALVDLSGLNFCIRMLARLYGKPIEIVSPTSVKKFAVANGQADKETMINAWKLIDTEMKDIKDIKIDDLADAYFISQYK